MKSIATYSFLPWLRSGVANTIASADGDGSVATRATIHVTLSLTGDPVGGGAPVTQPVAQDIALYGPGDIVGIDPRAVIRTEPRAFISNFEANYLAAIDFADEDFPWRYSPMKPDGVRLRPWIALVVMAEAEFDNGKDPASRPLPYVTVKDQSIFPPAGELWAWAHVHFNEGLGASESEIVSTDINAVLAQADTILQVNPDSAYSRLLCPRRLADNTGYHAFVVPVFETGRLAGLGLSPNAAPNATASAWGVYSGKAEPANFPYYYRWYFKTGTHGDFEYLVRQLTPQPVDTRVGTRDMDVQAPGSNIPGILDANLNGILRLGGALRVPDADLDAAALAERNKYEQWAQPYPHPFQKALAAFINLADDYAIKQPDAANAATSLGAGVDDNPDPLITAPLYGQWHALTRRLLDERDLTTPVPNANNWVHNLNLDPRFRVPAAFGADVVESNAEEYMNDAWEQIGDVLAANQKIRRLLMAREVSWRWHSRHLRPLVEATPERMLAIAAPVERRIMLGGVTIAAARRASRLAPVHTATAMRRIVRPKSRLMRALPFNANVRPDNLLTRVEAGDVSAAPPKVVPPGVPTVDQVAGAAVPSNIPPAILGLLRKWPWLPLAALLLALLIALLLVFVAWPVGLVLAAVVAAGGIYLWRLLRRWQQIGAGASSLGEAAQTPQAVDDLPSSPDFVISAPGANVPVTVGASDSPTAIRFKTGLRDLYTLLQASKAAATEQPPARLDLRTVVATAIGAIDPIVTIPRRAISTIFIPPWILTQVGERFGEVMAYPKIDLPMYEPLKAISAELFLPNINLIKPNSITLIETNQRFIEAYMVGLNHEFARKLLWREYPTDQRGSHFRQFWDVRSYFNADNLDAAALKEKLYDIPELHRWSLNSALGRHNNRSTVAGEDAVLVIRGELLKKYPNAVIYAHRAKWERKADNSIDLTQPRTLEDIDAALEDKPPTSIVRTPLYEAKVDPDIYFFGFDLTIPQAKGGPGTNPNDDPGWFFVIKERPGEPRFGLELERTGALEILDEVTWKDTGATDFLPAGSLAPIALTAPPAADPEQKKPQYDDDSKADAAEPSAARWAYILYRAPVMVAIHATEMLASGT